MSNKARVRLAALVIAAGLILGWIGTSQTVLSILPERLRSALETNIFVVALVFFVVAIFLLWDVASQASKLEEVAKDALRTAQEETVQLRHRIEATETKLIAAIDQGALDWSPAFDKIAEDLTGRLNGQYQMKEMQLEASFVSYKRQLRHGAPEFPGPGGA